MNFFDKWLENEPGHVDYYKKRHKRVPKERR